MCWFVYCIVYCMLVCVVDVEWVGEGVVYVEVVGLFV